MYDLNSLGKSKDQTDDDDDDYDDNDMLAAVLKFWEAIARIKTKWNVFPSIAALEMSPIIVIAMDRENYPLVRLKYMRQAINLFVAIRAIKEDFMEKKNPDLRSEIHNVILLRSKIKDSAL